MQSPGGPKEDPTGGFKHGGWVVPHFDETVANSVGEMFAKPLKLASSKSSASGVTISKYLRAGQVATGSFQLEPPIEAELERRRNLN
jgi:hypothetical protein